MFYVYIIRSTSKQYRYVGMCKNLESRIQSHQKGWNKTTKPYRPFMIIHTESYSTRHEARQREKWFKSGEGREFLDSLEI